MGHRELRDAGIGCYTNAVVFSKLYLPMASSL